MSCMRVLAIALITLLFHVHTHVVLLAVQGARANEKRSFSEASYDKSNFDQLSVRSARMKCNDRLQARVALIEKATRLNRSQREKLLLAGEIDIHRFFASYAAIKQSMRFSGISQNEWQAQFARARTEIQPLRARYQGGLHDDSSLFAKTLASTLDADQQSSVQEMRRQRARATYSDYIQVTLAIVDRTIPLTSQQRTEITELMLAKTNPPESYGTSTLPVLRVLKQMSTIETELRELFSDEEWKLMSQVIEKGRSGAE